MDDVGADGVTVREAIASRTLLGINQLIEAYRDKRLDLPSAYLGLKVLVETTLPFCDPESKLIVSQVMKEWDRLQREWVAVGKDLAISEGALPADFGAWGLDNP